MVRALVLLIVAALTGAAAVIGTYAVRPGFTLEMDRSMPGLLSGFYDTERVGQETFAWSRGEATLRLPGLDRRGAWTCVVRVRGGRADANRMPDVTFTVDGIVTGRHPTSNDFLDMRVPLAPQAGTGAVVTLTTETFVPGGADKRELGVFVDRWSCTPDAGFHPWPPRPAVRAAAIATTAFGAVLLLMSAPVAVFLTGVAAVAGTQAIPLTRDLGPFSTFAVPIEWLAVALTIVLGATFLVVSRVTLKRSISAAGRVALFVTCAILYLKLLVLFHPSKLVVDAVFHAHRLEWVLDGRYFFTQPMPGGVSFPYAIGLYVFAAPWSIFTTDLISLLRIVVLAAEATGGILIYGLVTRCWGDRVAAATAATFYGLVPRTFEIVGNANLTNAFAQSAALAALAAATLLPLTKGQWKAWMVLMSLCALALLSHISTLTLLSGIFTALVVLYRWFGRPTVRREAWMIATAFIVAGVLSVVLYYSHFGDAFRSAARVRATAGAVTTPTTALPTPASTITRLADVALLGVQATGWPLLLLAVPGAVAWVRRGWRDRLGMAIAALVITFFVFATGVAVMPVQQGFYRYALEFVTRVTLATYPAIVILAALGAVWGWRRGGPVRIVAALLAVAVIVTAGDAWLGWIR
ncbi:MAG TPA: hypothetical protein VMZ90_01495 [Vicinamibacterales bacterium]|nr:hypothetical protein [Vicinamibacterales bacterium]